MRRIPEGEPTHSRIFGNGITHPADESTRVESLWKYDSATNNYILVGAENDVPATAPVRLPTVWKTTDKKEVILRKIS